MKSKLCALLMIQDIIHDCYKKLVEDDDDEDDDNNRERMQWDFTVRYLITSTFQ